MNTFTRHMISGIAAFSTAGVAIFGATQVAAAASPSGEASATWGAINGFHAPGFTLRYTGQFKDRLPNDGHCVVVQRRSIILNGWTDSGIENDKSSCGAAGRVLVYSISPTRDDDTAGIRLVKVGTNVVLNLCTTRTECRTM